MAPDIRASATNDTIKTLLAHGRAQLGRSSESPALDAEILLCFVLGTNRADVFANPEREVEAAQAQEFAELVQARSDGRPVAQLTGGREFWSLQLKVSADVLVPRPETELLVQCALAHIPPDANMRVLDLGTGSGAIAIAIAAERPRAQITATDNSSAALAVAEENALLHVPDRIQFVTGDWYVELNNNSFDLIVSNPPYVATSDVGLTDPELQLEPAAALYSGADGLDDIRRIVAGAPDHLVAGGRLLLEHGFNQAEAVIQLLAEAGFHDMQSHADLAGIPRVTEAQFG